MNSNLAVICLTLSSALLAQEQLVNKVHVVDTPTDAAGDPLVPALKSALEILECLDGETQEPGSTEPGPGALANDLFNDGDLKTIPPNPYNGGPSPYGVHNASVIAIRTHDRVHETGANGEMLPWDPDAQTNRYASRSPEAIAKTINHELRHKNNTPAGGPGDSNTNPEIVGTLSALRNHANQHLDDIEFLCLLQEHWEECGDGTPFDCTAFGDCIIKGKSFVNTIERVYREDATFLRLRIRLIEEEFAAPGGKCGCTDETINEN